jgi:2,4-dienoyl-CoA reductase (NADPH2)
MSRYGNSVTIIEMLDDIARDMEMVTRKLNLMKLKKYNVSVYTNSKVNNIENGSIYFFNTNIKKEMKIENVDVYIIATGTQPNNKLYDKIKEKIPSYKIGDADKVGDVVSAIQSAYLTCKEL